MAEALLNALGRGRFAAFSAGTQPAGFVHPLALRILSDFHISTAGLHSKPWEIYQNQSFDFAITVCDRARETCPVLPGQPMTAHWGCEDPAQAAGTEAQKLHVFRKVFTEIQARIGLFLALPMDKLSRIDLEQEVRGIGTIKPDEISLFGAIQKN
jgi:arsenate reductase